MGLTIPSNNLPWKCLEKSPVKEQQNLWMRFTKQQSRHDRLNHHVCPKSFYLTLWPIPMNAIEANHAFCWYMQPRLDLTRAVRTVRPQSPPPLRFARLSPSPERQSTLEDSRQEKRQGPTI